MFLDNDEYLQALGAKVYVMNPKQIANFKKSYSDMDKTDEIDAFIIAGIGQIERFEDETKIAKYLDCTGANINLDNLQLRILPWRETGINTCDII